MEIEIPIPHGIFNTEPTPAPVLEALAANEMRESPINVKSKTKPTPTLVSNNYVCFTNDNDDDDDDEFVGHTIATNQVPRTGKSVQGMNNKMMTNIGMDDCNDDKDYYINKPPVFVAICELQNTAINRNLSTTVVLDLGTMININKGMPELVNINDDASAVIIATKNSSKRKYNKPMDIPQGFFDTGTKQAVNIPNKPKKYRKKKRHQ